MKEKKVNLQPKIHDLKKLRKDFEVEIRFYKNNINNIYQIINLLMKKNNKKDN